MKKPEELQEDEGGCLKVTASILAAVGITTGFIIIMINNFL